MTLTNVRSSLRTSAHPGSSPNLENLIIEHLDTVRELESIDAHMANLIVLVAQGYNVGECASRLGISKRTMTRRVVELREKFYTDVIPYMSMEVA